MAVWSRLGFFFAAYVVASLAVCFYLYKQQLMCNQAISELEGRSMMMRTGQRILSWPTPRSLNKADPRVTLSLHSWNFDFLPADCRSPSSERLAYISLLTNDNYLPGALVLFASLRSVGARYPLACLITSSVSETARAQLAFLNVTLIEVSSIEAPYESPTRPAIKNGFTKLHLWNLGSHYDKLFFLDADAIVLHNIDRMFEEYPGDFGVNWRYILKNPRFCSCTMVIRPSESEFKKMMGCYMTTESYDHGDQGFLTTFFLDKLVAPDYVQLPCREIMARPFPIFPHFLSQQIDFLHYAHHPKPWEGKRPSPLSSPEETSVIRDKEFMDHYWWGYYDVVTENLKAVGLVSNDTKA